MAGFLAPILLTSRRAFAMQGHGHQEPPCQQAGYRVS